MASFKYFWANRARFSPTSIHFYRAWGKRIFSYPEVFRRNKRRNILRRQGGLINETAEIGEVEIRGMIQLLSIGKESFLGKVKIAMHDEVIIGNRVCINDGVEILTASHDVNDPEWKTINGKIIIEDYVWIGTGAMILPGVTIGRGAVIGARSVVSKSVAEGDIVVGNPARSINRKRCDELNYNPCEFLAANRAWLQR